MRISAYPHADAHAPVSVRPGLIDNSASVLEVDHQTALYVHGTEAQRADFLRRLARVAEHAADELCPRIEVDGVPSLAVAGKFREYQGGAL